MTTDPISPPEAILFDVDGTLVDTYALYIESYRRALRDHLGQVPPAEEFIARPPTSELHFLSEWIGVEHAVACHDRMCGYYEELHAALGGGVYEGIREMLSALRSAGVRLGVVTGKGRRAWNVTEGDLGLGPFEVVVTEDDVDRPKPDPVGLIAAARTMAVDPAAVVYVGDSVADMEAGRRAGMRIGAALWPKETDEDRRGFLAAIEAHDPDWRFDRPAEVTRVFAAWC